MTIPPDVDPPSPKRPIAARALAKLRSPDRVGYTTAFAREAAWRMRPSPVRACPPTWELDRARLAQTVVRWPAAYSWPSAGTWLDTLVEGLRSHVRVDVAPLPQPEGHVVVAEIVLGQKRHRIAIDYADLPELSEERRREADLYFKLQFSVAGYGDESVVPGGFPPSRPELYTYLGRLRRLRDRQRFADEAYGRFSANYASETRRRAVELLRAQDVFRYEGGFQILRYARYMREVAQAKVCIDLPGNGPLCFRLIDYLAVGSCVVGPRPAARLHAPLTDGVNVVYCADDLSNLVELCALYLEDDEKRETVADAARLHFDRYLERTQWAAYYLHTIFARLD